MSLSRFSTDSEYQRDKSCKSENSCLKIHVNRSGSFGRIANLPLELLKREGASDEDLERVDDVKLEVYHMNNLSAEVRARFVSDMGFVVDYLNEGSFENRRNQKIVHVEALCEMMEALTGDMRFTEHIGELLKKQEDRKEIAMCEYIDLLEARGESKGETRLAELIQALLKEKKFSEIEAAAGNREKRHELYAQYGI